MSRNFTIMVCVLIISVAYVAGQFVTSYFGS